MARTYHTAKSCLYINIIPRISKIRFRVPENKLAQTHRPLPFPLVRIKKKCINKARRLERRKGG